MQLVATTVPALMIYDGLCGFCSGSVRWLLKHDKRDCFRFAPQQSPLAAGVLARHGINQQAMLSDNSVYLVLDLDSPRERLLRRSDVLVETLLLLGGGWRFLARLVKALSPRARDAAYTLVARNRFRLAGRYEVCPLPSASERQKFLA